MPTFPLGWDTEVLGNVKIVGRPFSAVSFTKGYDKHQVKAQLTHAVTYARQMLTETSSLVDRALISAIEMQVGTGPYGAVVPLSPIVRSAAVEHFKMPNSFTQADAGEWVKLFHHLKQVYMLIGQGIRGAFTIVDIPSADKLDTNGSVSLQNAKLLDTADPNGLRIADRGRIHINFHWITTRTAQRVARTIIHEGSHKFVGARDHAYKPNHAAYAGLAPDEAMANADSIACFAYYTWKNGAYKLDA